ncbi:MAG: putative lipid II flippase FtsW [Oscillospiraceae bacterium]|nr:putative lipid II flippase FtsW [Oscillospiraceae bacterium]MBQ2603339.1 putative lipid II flippase FtsW [Oscillospiraceae bacterium]
MDMPFFLLVLVILVIGVITVLSASFANAYYDNKSPTYYFGRQFIFAVLGIAAMLFISRLPVKLFRKFSLYLFAGTVFLLVMVKVPGVGITINGATRWLGIRNLITFQPSEIAKLSVVLLFANMACVYKDRMKTFRWGVLPFAGVLLILCGLVIWERHVSATAIILAVGAIMMFLGGTGLGWLLGAGGIAAAALVFIIKFTGYTSDRVNAWRDPFADRLNKGYQIIQSLYAIGSGGLLGVGIGQSRQKYLYLPYDYNDYIFSIYCEEMGFIGAVLLLVLFALLIMRGYWLAMHCRDRFGSLVITGITTLLAIQVFLNIAVVTNTMPSTGISLPFFSYGGTALLLQLAEMGIVLSISRDIPLKRAEKKEDKEK